MGSPTMVQAQLATNKRFDVSKIKNNLGTGNAQRMVDSDALIKVESVCFNNGVCL